MFVSAVANVLIFGNFLPLTSSVSAVSAPSPSPGDALYCSCGYAVPATPYTSGAWFKEVFETDWLHISDLRGTIGWRPQEFDVTPKDARGPLGKAFSLDNVVANPLRASDSYAGDSVLGGDAGLQLWSRSTERSRMLGSAEVASIRQDMLYGSFRVALKASSANGTCGAFFWYSTDTQEIDIEFLSKEFSNNGSFTNLVLQTPSSKAAGYDASKTPFFKRLPLAFRPDESFHEYRFDWLPDRISYFVDGQWQFDMTDDIPSLPGHLTLNHWSNGDEKWSAGPPNVDVVMTVSYVKAYYNSTDPSRLAATQKACGRTAPRIGSSVCVIPDQTLPPAGEHAETYFFSKDRRMMPGQTGGTRRLRQEIEIGLAVMVLPFLLISFL